MRLFVVAHDQGVSVKVKGQETDLFPSNEKKLSDRRGRQRETIGTWISTTATMGVSFTAI